MDALLPESPPEPRSRFTAAFVLVLLAGLATTAAVALLVDPVHTFGTGRVRPMLTGERDDKPAAFLARQPSPQAIVLGSSRVLKLRPACITELTGLPAYNFGVTDAQVEDMDAILAFIRDRGAAPLREIVIGLDVDVFDDRIEVDQRLISSPALGRYVAGAGLSFDTATRALFGYQDFKYGLQLVHYELRGSRPRDAIHFEPDGVIYYEGDEEQIAAGTFSLHDHIAANIARRDRKFLAAGFAKLSPARLALFRDVVTRAHAAGARVDVFVPPLHRAIAELRSGGPVPARLGDLDRFLHELDANGLIHYLPMNAIEDIGGDPDGYYDGNHLTETNSSRVLLAMFHRPHGCGL